MNTDAFLTVVDGQEVITLAGMALLVGVTVDDARAEFARQGLTTDAEKPPPVFRLPKDWLRRGKEILARVYAQYGTDALPDVIAILAEEASA